MPDSSPEATTDGATPAVDTTVTNADGLPPASSTGEKAGTMLDAVKSALEHKEASPPSEELGKPADGDPNAQPPDPAADESDELSEDELKGLHEKTQKRFKTLKSKLDAKDAEIGDLKPKAAEFDKINTFIGNAGLSNDEVSNMLVIGAKLKSDPKGAYEMMLPTIRALQQHLGSILPADLQQQVDQGYITEQHARQLVASRSEADFNAKRLKERDEADDRTRREREQTEFTGASIAAAETWESKKATTDPDWQLKRKDVAEQVELAIHQRTAQEGRPWFPNSKEIVELSEKALKTVNERAKRFGPRPAQIKPVTPGASNRSTPVPKSMKDVVKQTLGAA